MLCIAGPLRALPATLAVLLAVAVAGCSDGSADPGTPVAPTAPGALPSGATLRGTPPVNATGTTTLHVAEAQAARFGFYLDFDCAELVTGGATRATAATATFSWQSPAPTADQLEVRAGDETATGPSPLSLELGELDLSDGLRFEAHTAQPAGAVHDLAVDLEVSLLWHGSEALDFSGC